MGLLFVFCAAETNLLEIDFDFDYQYRKIDHDAEKAACTRHAVWNVATLQPLEGLMCSPLNRSRDNGIFSPQTCSLADVPLQLEVQLHQVQGARPFRRRLMELGLVPGTPLKVMNVAPLGDPLEIEVRGCRLSIRKDESRLLEVHPPVNLPPEGVEV